MLTSLTIKNYALIDDLNVRFNSGLTIITGETGAGKSILLGGLSLILGKRADLSQINDTTKKCIIEAVFDVAKYNLKAFFDEKDLDYESNTIVRREILPSGKSRAFINDTPVNLDNLQALGQKLIDIHSQHQTLELMNDDFRFQIIDALADNSLLVNQYRADLEQFKALKHALDILQRERNEALKELDYNTFLLKELDEAKLVSGELNVLESEYETLNNVEEIGEHLLRANSMLSHDDMGIISNLNELKQVFAKLSSFGEQYDAIFKRISSSLIEIDDVFSEVEVLQESLEADPSRLDQVNSKLQIIHNLLQKHTVATVDELIDIKDQLGQKVFATEAIDDDIQKKENEISALEKQMRSRSEEIHQNRKNVLPNLIDKLETLLSELGMPNAKFKIEIHRVDDFLSNGCDRLEFLFTANKGGQFNELKKAASGGELSRIMLAIKSVLAQYTQLPTIMFDEIDTGVSGEISNKMAAIMLQMSKSMQVFTITHLPQIAAKGNSHFKVFKEDINGRTQTLLKELNSEERIVEIAQMLGGTNVSNSAIAHAKQLLN
ncbi:MAG: DNA repair protein RecN [Psychroserpens sp.]|nr:DNA repair protein RecN [Psychroserpens sp.]